MKTTTARTLFLVIVLWFISSVVLAQRDCDVSCCPPEDHTPVGIMMSHLHKKGEWMSSYRFMNTNMKGNLSGSSKISDDLIYQKYLMTPRNMYMNMHMFMLMYGLTNRITVMGMVNYNSMSMSMAMLPGTMMNMPGMMMSPDMTSNSYSSSHFGDTKLSVLYGLVNQSNHHLLISAGLSLPTGSINIKGDSKSMYPNSRLPYMMQTGSGTVDINPGLTYLYRKTAFTWGTQANSALRTYYNSLSYKLGNEYTLTSWFAYQWSNWASNSIRIEGNTAGAIQGKDAAVLSIMEPSANPVNYGGQRINAYLGFNFYLPRGILYNNRLAIEYGIPVYQNVNGIQTGLRNTLYLGWQIKF